VSLLELVLKSKNMVEARGSTLDLELSFPSRKILKSQETVLKGINR
jgi:hypothetical protein